MDVDLATTVGIGAPVVGAIAAGWRMVHKSLAGQARTTRSDLVAQVNGLRQALEADLDRHRKEIDTKLADMDSELDAYNRNAAAFRAKVMDRFEQIATRSEMREDIGGLHRRLDDLFAKLGGLKHE